VAAAVGAEGPMTPTGGPRGSAGIYLSADPGDLAILDGDDPEARLAPIRRRLDQWKAALNA
jgi:hypothetical protein